MWNVKGISNDFKIFGLSTGRRKLPLTEMGRIAGRTGLEDLKSFEHIAFKMPTSEELDIRLWSSVDGSRLEE